MRYIVSGLGRVALSLLVVGIHSSCTHWAQREEAREVPAIQRAATAWRQIAAGQGTTEIVGAYDRAVAQIVREASALHAPKRWQASIKLADGTLLRVDPGTSLTHQTWSPRLFDSLNERKRKTALPGTTLRPGVGATFDGVHDYDPHEKHSRFVYSKGQHLPVTAVIEFNGPSTTPILHLYDPREQPKVKVGARQQDLAADFALPVQQVLNPRFFLTAMVEGLFRPERFLLNQGLYLQEPYRADKVPVIFVHGLMSDPHIWESEVLEIMADPEIGKRVQCWCFMYPTGLPVVSSAARLRASMVDARRTFDPEGRDPGFDQSVMVGHSMGGILTRMQIEDSGEAYWRTWFRVDPAKLKLDAHISSALQKALIFDANPSIKNVIFIATPHRGSSMADGWIARVGAYLIRAPQQIVQIATSIATLDVAMLAPERVAVGDFGLTSISSLSPNHPIFIPLNARPMTAPCHSIIGNLGSTKPLKETTDGVVPYTSSHLDEAVSEKVVPYWHGCVEHVECADEVTRIIREHLAKTK